MFILELYTFLWPYNKFRCVLKFRFISGANYQFYDGEWGRMNARDRGKLMYKLAGLMKENAEELATLESIDSGAVYTRYVPVLRWVMR